MKARLLEVNILRAIAAIAVVLLHISASPVSLLEAGSKPLLIFTTFNRSLVFCMPVFVFISGLTLFYNYEHREFKYFPFILKRLKAVLIAYLIWSLIYYSVFLVSGVYSFSLSFLFEKLLLADMVYHLYFIALIVQFYLLFVVFLFIFKKDNAIFYLGISLILNLLFFKLRASLGQEYAFLQYADRFFLQYIFFFSLGCYLAKDIDRFKQILTSKKIVSLLSYLGITLVYSFCFYKSTILGIPVSSLVLNLLWFTASVVGVFFSYLLALFLLNTFFKRSLEKIGEHSFMIYLAHPLVLMISTRVFAKLGIISITGMFLLNTIFVFSVTILGSILYARMKKALTLRFF